MQRNALLTTVREQLVGRDPFDIERHAAVLSYYAAGLPYEGPAGVDIALWDVVGKLCGQPLYKLWGGGRRPGGALRQPDAAVHA